MRRIVLFFTVALVVAAMIAAGAMPTFAKQAKTGGEGRQVGAGTCAVGPFGSYTTIQSAVDASSCQTIQLSANSGENVTIDRNLTITGSGANLPPIVGGSSGKSVFTILPGKTVTFEDFHIDGGGGASVEQGGGIHNQGTLVLTRVFVRGNQATDGGGIYNGGTLTMDGGEVFRNTAANDGGGIYNAGTLTLNGTSVSSNVASGDGGGIFNQGTLYLCGNTTVSGNQAPVGTEDDVSGTPAQDCPTSLPPGGGSKGGNGVLVEHKGKELCLPEAALKAHVDHGDEVIDEQGCSDAAGAKKNGKHGRGGGVSGKKQ